MGEEVVERTIYPDGRVVERIIRRVATGATRSDSAEPQPLPSPRSDSRPPPAPMDGAWDAITWSFPSPIDHLPQFVDLLSAGISHEIPWELADQSETWASFDTSAPLDFGARGAVAVDVIAAPPGMPNVLMIRVRAAERPKGLNIGGGYRAANKVMEHLKAYLRSRGIQVT